MDKKQLSVCIIAKNEEKFIADCIESVKPAASEIIVVDTGSEDNTVSIAQKLNCRVFEIPWENDFSKARNFCLSKAVFPYILTVDADERLVNPELISNVLNSSKADTGGWLIDVISTAKREDGSFDTFVSKLLRLFVNNENIRYTGIIHEQIVNSIIDQKYKIESTPLKINHYGYSHEPEIMKKKQYRNLDLLNTAIKMNSNDSYSIFQRAKTWLALGNLMQAEADIRKCLELVGKDSVVYPQALNYGAIIAFQLGNSDTALNRAYDSLKIIPNQSFANFVLGETYSSKNNFQMALESYLRMDKAQSNPDMTAHIAGDYYLPPEHLCFRIGKALVGLKRYDEAEKYFITGNKFAPDETSNLVGLSNVEYNRKNFNKARDFMLKAIAKNPKNKDLKNFLSQIETAMSSGNIPLSNREYSQKFQSGNDDVKLISLSMIVKNEELMLEGCLESVINCVDEIIIVDTGSTDNTKKIAEKYGAKIFDYPWKNDFADARNKSLKHCSGQWVLYLDADERLNPASSLIIRQLCREAPENIDGFICTIESKHLQLGDKTELHRGGYPRLFRNHGYPKIHFVGRVHEQITPSIFALGKSIVFSDMLITHLGYNQTREVMESKIKRNYALLIEHVKEEPLNAYAWYQLGQTLAQMNIFNEAESSIRFSIQLGTLSDSVYASATATLSQFMGNQKNYAEALDWAKKSLDKVPEQVYALHLYAYSLLYLNRFKEAEEAFLEVLRRLNDRKGAPRTGFDIEIPENVVMQGLNEARKFL